MPITKTNSKEAARNLKKFNWSRIDAMTDKNIARQIASNPDSAPDQSTSINTMKTFWNA
ncbi:MAG: hypothetical protein ABTQ34_04780 [Bdellovibrionales bacterium]